ncbi:MULTISPECIES: preprotein translocase subunit YajC [unclassified Clostridium]|uniref:preprotein translocase subunit YajC n=1 Tax=unclassified Clostridium TaxID=2614128 RepID=UPI000FDC41B9|nr:MULTISPECIES: preprotein translocase subunit YajC [unclassified Clostridium]AZV58143.1 preprotein translocase subunit YajC [Clostridium sp. AWRP]QXE18470.1 preprotein translocase subunit YajC [Clostridium sp. 001]
MDSLVRLAPLLFIVVIFYLLIFLPESKRKKKYNAMLESLKVNDEVMTKGGIIGKVVNIQDRNITIQTGPDRVRIKLDKTGVLNILSEPKSQENSSKKIEEKKEEKKEV